MPESPDNSCVSCFRFGKYERVRYTGITYGCNRYGLAQTVNRKSHTTFWTCKLSNSLSSFHLLLHITNWVVVVLDDDHKMYTVSESVFIRSISW